MVGLIALLFPPARDIAAEFPNTIHHTFVGDRTWASPTCAQTLAVQQCWAHWSNLLGLKENRTKAQYFPLLKGAGNFLIVASPMTRSLTGLGYWDATCRVSFGASCATKKRSACKLQQLRFASFAGYLCRRPKSSALRPLHL